VPAQLILGIESSCDETSAAIVRDGSDILANVVASQLVHADYGGVVPELASREHLRAITPVVREAMRQASEKAGREITYADLDAIAVTEGPGLAGALLVGITFAKSLAFAAGKPLIAVNHLEGHIHAVLMHAQQTFANADRLLALVVSGGHTHFYFATREAAQREDAWRYRNVGKTLDDAAGEAFDKVAKLLGLPYPGGPWMDALAPHGDPRAVPFAFAQIKTKASGNVAPKLRATAAVDHHTHNLEASREDVLTHEVVGPPSAAEDARRFDVSFSGIKTAVRRYTELHAMQPAIEARAAALHAAGLTKVKPTEADNLARALEFFDTQTLNLIASFQSSATQYLTRTMVAAAAHYGAQGLIVSGGVAANSELRTRLTLAAQTAGRPIAFPSIALSTDNAAMIAAAAFPKLRAQLFASPKLEPTPQLRLG
jgi:N6-L-threonylcarbamoyladenine synthase